MKQLATLIPALLLSLPPALRAEEPQPAPTANDSATLQTEAARLHDEANEVRAAAEVEHTKTQKECWHKFLVSKCQEEAGLTYRTEKARASSLDSRARAMERELKRRKVAEKDAQRAEKDAAQSTRAKP